MDDQSSFQESIKRSVSPGVSLITLTRKDHKTFFITIFPVDGEGQDDVIDRARVTVLSLRANVVSMDLFAIDRKKTEAAFTRFDWPVTSIQNGVADPLPGFGGLHILAVSDLNVIPLRFRGRLLGNCWSDSYAYYCCLGNIVPENIDAPNTDQAKNVLETMEQALSLVSMDFTNVARTWYFFEDILAWYPEFNKTRDSFFKTRKVFDGLPPASTGIGGKSPSGCALTAGLFALQPIKDKVSIENAPSPLQCPAISYGSSFSRAVEIVVPDVRKVMVSGTASISPEGETVCKGDVEGQIDKTMTVVEALLKSRKMDFEDVTRAIAYFKHSKDLKFFKKWLIDHELPDFPHVCLQNDVCWDDLLFEVEVDAVRTTG